MSPVRPNKKQTFLMNNRPPIPNRAGQQYYNQQQQHLPPYQPQQQRPPPSNASTISIDHETLRRFQDLELNHVTSVSSLESQMESLKRQNEQLTQQLATNESVISHLQTANQQLSNNLAAEQQSRHQDRLQMAKLQTSSDPKQYQQLLDQLHAERVNNKQWAESFTKMKEKYQRDTDDLRRQIGILTKNFQDEEMANTMLNQSLGKLKVQLQDILQHPPVQAPSSIDPKEFADLKLTLEDERFRYFPLII